MILRRGAAALAAAALLLAPAGCKAESKPRQNVRPPSPGVPAAVDDITGIYRTVHQGVLQLRATGELVLVIPDGVGASSGTFTLQDGIMRVTTDKCGTDVGTYRVVVTGEAEPDKAALAITGVDDPCQPRLHYLTVDPWVYAVS